jgi:uncharacterized protein YndB with AHSA1/START domain
MNAPSTRDEITGGSYADRPASDTLRLERLLPGPIERVWSWLTESEKRGQWLASGDMDQRVGGRVELVFRNSDIVGKSDPPPAKYADMPSEMHMAGRITECDPPYRLAYTWTEGAGESLVTFELAPRGKDVLLVLTHTRIAAYEDLIAIAAGWHTHVGILIDRLRGREPKPFWPVHMGLEAEYEERFARAT